MTAYNQTPRGGVTMLRWVSKSKASTAQLSVPAFMARQISPGARFIAEWHSDGILFRFIDDDEDVSFDVPAWVTGEVDKSKEES